MKKIITLTIIGIVILLLGSYVFAVNMNNAPKDSVTLDLDLGNNDGGATPVVYDVSDTGANATAANAQTCDSDGCTFDGSADYMTATGTGVYNTANVSIAVKFTPDFDTSEDAVRNIYSDSLSDYVLQVRENANNNVLNILLGGTQIATIAEATYSPYWNVGQENVLIISGTTGDTDAWLNGNQILTADNTAWSPTNPATIYIGSSSSGTVTFDGTIHTFKVWNRLLSTEEVADISEDREQKQYIAPRNGLVGYWSLDAEDENSGTFYDRSGNGNDGTGRNVTSDDLTTGKIKEAVDFDGSTEEIQVADDPSIQLTGAFTVSAYVNARNWSAGSSTGRTIVEKYNYNFGTYIGWELGRQFLSGSLMQFVVTNAGSIVVASGSISDADMVNQWVHLVGVYTPSTSLKIYKDGVLLAQQTTSVPASFVDSGTGLSIGQRSDNDTQGYWDGLIDEVRLYNRALSADEVANLYNATRQKYEYIAPRNGLVGYWNMDSEDISGTTVYDRSGSGINMTMVNTPTTGQEGKIKDSINLESDNDEYLTNSSCNGLMPGSGSLTLATWIKATWTEGGNYDRIFEIYEPNGVGGRFIFIGADGASNADLRYRYDDGTNLSAFTFSDIEVFDNTWHHLVIKFDRSDDKARAYMDGVESAENYSISTIGAINTATECIIGITGDKVSSSLDGNLDDFRIYNRALSADEITNLYNATRQNYVK